MSIIGDLTNKITSVVSKVVEKAAPAQQTENSGGATINTKDSASVTEGYSAGSTKVASLDDVDGGKGSDEIRTPAGSRSSASAHETTAADGKVSDDVKEIAGRLMESDDVKNPHMEDSNGNTIMTLDDITVLAASGGNDEIHVSKGTNGGIVVSVNGEEYSYTRSEAEKLIIDGGKGNDNITVDEDVTLDVNITGGKGNDRITGGSGNDIIIDNYDSNVIDGGSGDDLLMANGNSSKNWFARTWDSLWGEHPNNVVRGGEGNDYIEGGFGNDTISGGAGDDYIYGLSGNDTISGGDGHDYIDGGKGNDTISGGAGTDNLFGGLGDDTISGGDGDDVIAGGKGKDTISGDAGADHITIYSDGGKKNADTVSTDDDDRVSKVKLMNVPGDIKVSGNAAFKERAQSDLETLASIAPGQAALNALHGDKHNLKIKETYGGNVNHSYTSGNLVYDKDNHATRGKGADSWIGYNVATHNMYGGRNTWDEHAPITSLVHEMGHSYNYATGTADPAVYDSRTHEHILNADGTYSTDRDLGEAGCEWQTIGGIGYSKIDDGNARTENPKGFSENSMRNYLGYDLRDTYWSSSSYGDPVDTDNFID
ncbi:MAG: hypothetical protein K6G50_08740 [bacterium]|nr:hypothetical protein [bacterium]